MQTLACVLLATLAHAACAAPPWDLAANAAATLVSDKVFRGISQTQGRATVQFDLNLHSDTGWTAGFGVTPLRTGGNADQSSDAEVVVSLGRDWQLDATWSLQAAAARYVYPGRGRRAADYDYSELSATLGWQGRWFAMLAVSPDTVAFDPLRGRRRGHTTTVELTGRQRLVGPLALDAGVGYYDLRSVRGAGYRFSSVGLSVGHGPLQAYVMRIDSNAARRGLASAEQAGTRWVTSLMWTF